MKKVLIIFGILFLIIIIGILSFSYYLTGNLAFSYSCGSTFSKQFDKAVATNDITFCLNYTGDLNQGTEIIYGGKYCIPPSVGYLKDNATAISKKSFKQDCYHNFAYATRNINACLQMDKNDGLKEVCVRNIAIYTKNADDCDFLASSSIEHDSKALDYLINDCRDKANNSTTTSNY